MSSSKTILIVDDDRPLAEAIAIELKNAGYQVVLASDGSTGYDLALKKKPKLILLDILMPNLDGLEMLKKLRQKDNTYCTNVPVVILTNLDSEEVVHSATQLNCTDFLIKTDTSLSKIVETIKQKI